MNGIATPWGESDSVYILDNGVMLVSTSGHADCVSQRNTPKITA